MKVLPDKLRLFHITSMSNLIQIGRCGALLSKNRLRDSGLRHESIAYENIQDRRSRTPVPVSLGGMLHDYVPFHFAPRQPMLMALHYGNVPDCTVEAGDVIHLVLQAEGIAVAGLPFAFATHHPVTAIADFYDSLDHIGRIDWRMFFDEPLIGGYAKYFHNPQDRPEYATRRETRQAEFLVHGQVPIDLVRGMGVLNDDKRAKVQSLLNAVGWDAQVEVRREWYF